jgi:hypothetical protein
MDLRFLHLRVCRVNALGISGSKISESEEKQTSSKEDFALAVPEENSPFAGTEKDGELVMSYHRKNPVSCDVWLDPGTLQYLRGKTFEKGTSA